MVAPWLPALIKLDRGCTFGGEGGTGRGREGSTQPRKTNRDLPARPAPSLRALQPLRSCVFFCHPEATPAPAFCHSRTVA